MKSSNKTLNDVLEKAVINVVSDNLKHAWNYANENSYHSSRKTKEVLGFLEKQNLGKSIKGEINKIKFYSCINSLKKGLIYLECIRKFINSEEVYEELYEKISGLTKTFGESFNQVKANINIEKLVQEKINEEASKRLQDLIEGIKYSTEILYEEIYLPKYKKVNNQK